MTLLVYYNVLPGWIQNHCMKKNVEFFFSKLLFLLHFIYLKILCAKRVPASVVPHLIAAVGMISITFFLTIRKSLILSDVIINF